MKKGARILFALIFLLVLWTNGKTHSNSITRPGNIDDGTYMIVGVASHRCLDIPNNSCRDGAWLQTFDCDTTDATNSQKWAMSQYGSNLEIRTAGTNQCMDVMRAARANFGEVSQRPCKNSTNQRWNLYRKTINADGVICRASPSHPEHNCYGLNEKQGRTYLGKTLTKAQCEEACKTTRMLNCQWEGSH